MLIVQEICAQYGYVIDEMQSHVNQLHFLLDISPPISAVEIIHKNKQISTFRIYKKHRAFFEKTLLEGKIRSESDRYFVCSTGDASIKTTKKIYCPTRITPNNFPYISEPEGIGVLRSIR